MKQLWDTEDLAIHWSLRFAELKAQKAAGRFSAHARHCQQEAVTCDKAIAR